MESALSGTLAFRVRRSARGLLFGYGIGGILFTGVKDVLHCAAVLGSASVSKQLDGHGWNCQQEGDQDCSEVAHGLLQSSSAIPRGKVNCGKRVCVSAILYPFLTECPFFCPQALALCPLRDARQINSLRYVSPDCSALTIP